MLRRKLLFVASIIQILVGTNAHAEAMTFARVEELWRAANIDLRLSQHAAAAAAGDLAAANRRENPTLSLSATSLSPRTGIGAGGLRGKNADSVLRIEQLVERGDKRALRSRSADARLGAARAESEESERAGRIQLGNAYWDLKAAEERAQLAGASSQIAREGLVAAHKRLAAGDLSPAEVSRLRVDALRYENDARLVAGELQRAQLGLALMIGREADATSLVCADQWPPATVAFPTGQDEDKLGARPDVRAARLRLDAAEAALASARALGKRDVTVGLQFEHYPAAGDLPPNNTWGLSISMPLFASHAYEGEILRANAERDQALDLVSRARALALAEFQRAQSDLMSSRDRLQRLEEGLLPEAGKVLEAAEFAYRKGAIGLLDLLDARRTSRQTLMDAIAARSDFAKAQLAIGLQFPAKRGQP